MAILILQVAPTGTPMPGFKGLSVVWDFARDDACGGGGLLVLALKKILSPKFLEFIYHENEN